MWASLHTIGLSAGELFIIQTECVKGGTEILRLGLVQAVLVTNQIFAGSLGADALAAAAIGFTVSGHTAEAYAAAVMSADILLSCLTDALRVRLQQSSQDS